MSVTTVCRDISALTENAQKACNLFLERCTKAGLPVCITETYRSQERQNYLYAQGRTRSGNIVTWTKSSRHTSRRAWDVCKNAKGQEYSDTSFFKQCGAIAAELGITWGGTWDTPDMPHFEISENWIWKDDDRMTESERQQMNVLAEKVQALENSREKVYHYFSELPDYARPIIQEMYDSGVYKGESAADLNLPENLMRTLVILHRMKGQ